MQITIMQDEKPIVFEGEILQRKMTSFIYPNNGGVQITATEYRTADGKILGSLGKHQLNEHNYIESSAFTVWHTDVFTEFQRVLELLRHPKWDEITHF